MGTKRLSQYASKYGNGLSRPFILETTPPTTSSFAQYATVGAQLVDSAGTLYVCTAYTGGASPSATWSKVGLQT